MCSFIIRQFYPDNKMFWFLFKKINKELKRKKISNLVKTIYCHVFRKLNWLTYFWRRWAQKNYFQQFDFI